MLMSWTTLLCVRLRRGDIHRTSPLACPPPPSAKLRGHAIAASLVLGILAFFSATPAMAQRAAEPPVDSERPTPRPPQPRSDAQPSDATIAKLSQSIVKIQAFVPPEARSASRLGTKREGSGAVIDKDGLVVTIGYLISEAMAVEVTDYDGKSHHASVVGYDQSSGFGLIRLNDKPNLPPMALGDSTSLAERQPVIIAAAGGADSVQPALVVSRREFAGSWEYLLDHAIYTAPPSPQFGGAALIGADGKLLGIGSLTLSSVIPNQPLPGNVFVPIDLLQPMLKDIATGRKPRAAAKPWLGMNTDDLDGGMLIVGNVSKDGPASKAGVQPNDVVISVANHRINGLADFYRRVWALGGPGVDVPLEVMQKDGFRRLTIKSADRTRYLKQEQTY
jgi:S1-C subfamily serine protease